MSHRPLPSAFIVVLALAGLAARTGLERAGPSGPCPAFAEPRVIGRTQTGVRILRGGTETAVDSSAGRIPGDATGPGPVPDSGAAPGAAGRDASRPAPDLAVLFAERTPQAATAEATSLAARLVRGYGGAHALRSWLGSGVRRGRQRVFAPAHVEGNLVDRRDGGRLRLDYQTGGYELSIALGPEGGWQRVLGLVTDLPGAAREEAEISLAHDEGLLLEVGGRHAPARVVRREGQDELLVWGPRGSPTLFVPEGRDDRLREILFRDRSSMRDADVVHDVTFDDFRDLDPDRSPETRGPAGARVPFVLRHAMDGQTVEELDYEAVDLLAALDDSVFARPGSERATAGPAMRVTVPLEREGAHHFVLVSVNGGPPRRFLVDSGAGLTTISRELADTLGVDAGESVGVVGVGGDVEARSTSLASVAIGTAVRRDAPCLVLDFGEMRRRVGFSVDGILGFSALNRYAVTFDFEQGTLSLAENEPSGERLPPGSARVPFENTAGQVTVEGRVDGGRALPFIVDTGAWITFVPHAVGTRLEARKRLPGVPVVGADGRLLEGVALRARSLAIGSARLVRPVVLYPTGGGAGDPVGITLEAGTRGILGANFLTAFRVTLDYPRGELVLVPRRVPPPAAEAEFVGPGLVAAPDAEGYRVSAVVEGSPAARAGVRVGERLLAVGGTDVAGRDPGWVLGLLGGAPATLVEVTIAGAGGRTRKLTLERVLLL